MSRRDPYLGRPSALPGGLPPKQPKDAATRRDNLRSGSPRSLVVTPDELERSLRDCLTRQVAAPLPPTGDLAGSVLRRANRIRHGRMLTGMALAAVATIAVSAGVAQVGGGPARQPWQTIVVVGDPPTHAATPARSVYTPELVRSTPASPSLVRPTGPPRVDLVLATGLNTATGQVVDLSAVGTVTEARRTSGGWLVVGTAEGNRSSLWFATADHPPRRLLSGVEAVTSTTDGQQIAWRDGSEIFAATIADGRIITRVQTPVPAQAVPIGFVGFAVLLRRGGADTARGYDLWWPNQGSLGGSWTTVPVGVYGALPDGHTVVGQVAAGVPPRPCLALLDGSRDLVPVRTACGARLTPGGFGAVSPDGRWLVANGTASPAPDTASVPDTASTEAAFVVDLKSAFDKAVTARAAGPRLDGGAVWTDARTVVHVDKQGELVRVAADRAAAGDEAVETFPAHVPNAGDRPLLVTGTAP